MAGVYVLYSEKLGKYYIGSCLNLEERLIAHKNKEYTNSFTAKSDDWVLYFLIDNLDYKQARGIEKHIKQMKSKAYIENLKKYKEISIKLTEKYRK